GLDLDQVDRLVRAVLQTVDRSHRDVCRLVLMQLEYFLATGHRSGAAHDHPVLGTMSVLLQREARTGLHDQSLHLEPLTGIDRFIRAPGAKDATMMFALRPLRCGKAVH